MNLVVISDTFVLVSSYSSSFSGPLCEDELPLCSCTALPANTRRWVLNGRKTEPEQGSGRASTMINIAELDLFHKCSKEAEVRAPAASARFNLILSACCRVSTSHPSVVSWLGNWLVGSALHVHLSKEEPERSAPRSLARSLGPIGSCTLLPRSVVCKVLNGLVHVFDTLTFQLSRHLSLSCLHFSPLKLPICTLTLRLQARTRSLPVFSLRKSTKCKRFYINPIKI